MNEDNDNLQPWIEPELEARIVAWVVGEASAFEITELERLAAENPELAIFKRRIETVHGLVGAAMQPPGPAIRLSSDHRKRLLETIDGPKPTATRPEIGIFQRARLGWLDRRILVRMAAILVVLVMIGTLYVSISTFQTARERGGVFLAQSAQRPYVEKMRDAQREMTKSSPPAAKNSELEFASLEASESSGRFKEREDVRRRSSTEAPFGLEVPSNGKMVADAEDETSDGYDVKGDKNEEGFLADVSLANSLEEGKRPAIVARVGETAGKSPGQEQMNDRQEKSADLIPEPEVLTSGDGSGRASGIAAAVPREQALQGFSREPLAAVDLEADASHTAAENSGDNGTFAGGLQLEKPKTPSATLPTSIAPPAAPMISESPSKKVGDLKSASSITAKSAGRPALTTKSGHQANEDIQRVKDAPVDFAKKAEPFRPGEVMAGTQPFSTFSLHVADVSFQLAKDALERDEKPDAAQIRPEEFYNAFDYGDPSPTAGEAIAGRIEQAAHPFLQQRNLVRIAMKVAATGRGAGQPLRLTVLLDTSGSMEREDRTATVRRALTALASLLGPDDRVTLIGFARQPRILAEQLAGNDAGKLVELARRTPSDGGTNLEEALDLASNLARRHRMAAAQNRIVLLTDGAANLGNADPARLAKRVEKLRQQGIAFDACGVGADGLDDGILEALTRQGDGRYYFLNEPAAADAGFARQLAGAFRPAAKNVKVQVRFNPSRVGKYRLIGFEQHRLKKEDFRNDRVDAAELSAEEAAVALYQVEPLPEGEGELGEVFVRFRDPATGAMVERSWTIPYDQRVPAFDQASPSMQLAGVSAMLAEKLRGGPVGDAIQLDDLAPVVTALRRHYPDQVRVRELVRMFDRVTP